MTAMGCIFLFREKEKANGAFDIEQTKDPSVQLSAQDRNYLTSLFKY